MSMTQFAMVCFLLSNSRNLLALLCLLAVDFRFYFEFRKFVVFSVMLQLGVLGCADFKISVQFFAL